MKNVFNVSSYLVLVFANFLFYRKIGGKISEFISSEFIVNRGIGQGTVNGPCRFILFFNQVGKILGNCKYLLFADDLVIYLGSQNVENGLKLMSTILCKLDDFCSSIGLSISFEKTKFMVIHKPQCKVSNELILPCNGNLIERVSVFKYLGVFIDEHFTFKDHYEHVLKRVCSSVGMIQRNRTLLTPHMLVLLINAYVNSITDYCVVVWGPSRISDFKNI